jgi:hypothetical protein
VISCKGDEPALHGDNEEAFTIISVFGQPSQQHFIHCLAHLRAEFHEKLNRLAGQVSPAGLDLFHDQLDRRYRRIGRVVTAAGTRGIDPPSAGMISWNPKHVRVEWNGRGGRGPGVTATVFEKTRRYALLYYLVLQKMQERSRFAGFVARQELPVAGKRPDEQQPVKFRLNGTVASFGALLRLLYDRDIIHDPVVAELCRQFAGMFQTNRQEEISPKSLRNAFDDPKPETLQVILATLKQLIPYIEKFIERQKR